VIDNSFPQISEKGFPQISRIYAEGLREIRTLLAEAWRRKALPAEAWCRKTALMAFIINLRESLPCLYKALREGKARDPFGGQAQISRKPSA